MMMTNEVEIRLHSALDLMRSLIIELVLLARAAEDWRASGAVTIGRQLQAALETYKVHLENKKT